MNYSWLLGLMIGWAALLAIGWLVWQLLRQNGRILLRLEDLDQRLTQIEFGEPEDVSETPASAVPAPESNGAADGNGEDRANRFKNHSLARSKLKRDGLKAGTPAPDFRLPRLDGRGDLSLSELRGRPVLLVFSSPHCGPCNSLSPKLEEFRRAQPDVQVLMISRGEPGENRVKVKEHRLTFPIVLQQQWEISRLYAKFATPVAYLIDEAGLIAHDVAVGVDAILRLMQGMEDGQGRQTPRSWPAEALI